MPINITIDHATSEHSSQGSSVTDEEDSSGTGVQVSPSSAVGSQEYSDSLEENERWQVLHAADPDDIGPSESASRPRTSNHHRPIVEASRPELANRQPARRQVSYDHRHHSLPRAHRQAPVAAPGSVDSNEEYPAGYARGPPPHHGRIYQHWGHAGTSPANYAPNYSSSQPYSPFPTTSIVPAGQQLTPFVNPGPYAFPPYQSAPGAAAPGYFSPGHHGGAAMGNTMGPHSSATYGGQDMMHPAPGAAYYPYSPQAYPMPQAMAPPPMYPPYAVYSPPPPPPPPVAPAPAPAPAAAATPPPPAPPADNSKADENFARLEKLFLDQKAEQNAKEAAAKKAAEDAAAKAASDKKIAEDIAAAASAAAAAATEEAEKRAADEKAKDKAEAEAAADKAAKEAAEKKAAEEAAAAAAAAAVPPPPPPAPEEKKKPIKFKDAVGRKFSFPFHLCNTWTGMEDLIRQAFLHVEVIGPHVAEGHYDLVGTNGEIILPQVWGTVIEPDTTITMHMWPMPEPAKVDDPLPAAAVDVIVVPEAKKEDPGLPPEEPPALSASGGIVNPAVAPSTLFGALFVVNSNVRSGKKPKAPKPKQATSIGWFAGRPAKPKMKRSKGGKKGAEVVPPAPPPPPPAPPAPPAP